MTEHFLSEEDLKDECCPTAALSNTDRPSGPAYSTGELLNTPLLLSLVVRLVCV